MQDEIWPGFSFLRWHGVLKMSVEIAVSEQSTSQIRQWNPCKRWSSQRQVSFRGVDFSRLKSCTHVVVPICLCQSTRVWRTKKPTPQPRARNVACSLPHRPGVVELICSIHVLCKFSNVCLFFRWQLCLIWFVSPKGTQQSPSQKNMQK